VAEIFDRKVAEASLTPPKLGLTGRREERTGSATDMFALTAGLGWNFSSGGSSRGRGKR